jgi:hypothetical protein
MVELVLNEAEAHTPRMHDRQRNRCEGFKASMRPRHTPWMRRVDGVVEAPG